MDDDGNRTKKESIYATESFILYPVAKNVSINTVVNGFIYSWSFLQHMATTESV